MKVFMAVLAFSGVSMGSVLWGQDAEPSAAVSAGMPETGVLNLTMAETLRRVEEANLNVLLSKEAVLQAIEAANRERSSILPRVDFNVRQTRSKFLINETGSGQGGSSTLNNFTAKLVGNYTIIDAKVNRTEAELARSEAFFGVAPGTSHETPNHERVSRASSAAAGSRPGRRRRTSRP